ncbi:MAG: GEVED domain-containing protein [Pirellulales bacterium]
MTIRNTNKLSPSLKRSLKKHLRAKRKEANRKMQHEKLEERQLLAADVSPNLVSIQPNAGELILQGDVRNDSPRNLVFNFAEVNDAIDRVDPTTLGYNALTLESGLLITRGGPDKILGTTDDVTINGDGNFEGFIGLGDAPNEVIVRFGEALPDDVYRIQVTDALKDLEGDSAEEFLVDFELNLGPQIMSVVPQPVTRNTDELSPNFGELEVARDQIVVYFNNDDLDQVLAENPTFYQLYFEQVSSNGFVESEEIFFPTSVVYDADLDMATLTFEKEIDQLTGSATEANIFRLQVGTTEISSKPSGKIYIGNEHQVFEFTVNDSQIEELNHQTFIIDDIFSAPVTYELVNSPFFDPADSANVAIDISAETTISGVQNLIINTINASGYAVIATATSVPGRTRIAAPSSIPQIFLPPTRSGLEIVLPTVGSSFETATDLTDDLNGPQEFQLTVSDSNLGLLDHQTFTIDDGNTPPITYELVTTPNSADPANTEIDISAETTRAGVILKIFGLISTDYPPIIIYDLGQGRFHLENTDPSSLALLTLPSDSIGIVADRSQTLVIESEIRNETTYTLEFPGAVDDPGHRDIQEESHVFSNPDSTSGITTRRYNFPTLYGIDPASPTNEPFQNQITDIQRQRALEIFELYSYYSGLQFIQVPDDQPADLQVVTGDLRGLSATIDTGPGGVAGLAGGTLAIMDMADFDQTGDDAFGAGWQRTAFHEIGHLLGLGHSYELPPQTIQGSDGGLSFGQAAEQVFPGNHDLVHLKNLYRPESKDIDLFRFELPESGTISAEIMAERLANSSLLDAVVTVYQENGDGSHTVFARNDDYFSEDSFIELELEAGTYFIGVTASGNNVYDPTIEDSGIGGTSQGNYTLQLQFRPDADSALLDTGAQQNSGQSFVVKLGGTGFSDGDTIVLTDDSGDPLTNSETFEFDIVTDLSDPASISNPDHIAVKITTGMRASEIVQALVSAINSTSFGISATSVGNRIDLSGTATNNAIVLDSSILSSDSIALSEGASGGAALDGDLDGKAGGLFNFWFQAAAPTETGGESGPITIFVDKSYVVDSTDQSTASTGSLTNPFTNIADAIILVEFRSDFGITGDVIRVTAERSLLEIIADEELDEEDGDNLQSNNPVYLIGEDPITGVDLEDGHDIILPQGVTMMIDEGVILKFAQGSILVGTTTVNEDRSLSSLQILGVPERYDGDEERKDRRVVLTSYNEANGVGDSPETLNSPAAGDWGGIILNNEIDRQQGNNDWESRGIFLSSIIGADIRYAGGTVSPEGSSITPTAIFMEEARPTINFNKISDSAGAALSADPDSFEESNFQMVQGAPAVFTPDIERIGPDIFGNRITNNSLNGLLVRVRTAAGQETQGVTVSARFDDTDIVHVLQENLEIESTLSGPTWDGVSATLDARLDGSLVIDPSVVIKLNRARIETHVGANLIAEGGNGSEIIFTSLNDDRYGFGGTFDTNNSGSASSAVAGDWAGLYFGHASSGSLDNILVSYGGGESRIEGGSAHFNPLEIHQADVRLTNSLIEFNEDGRGASDDPNRSSRMSNATGTIFVRGAQPIIVGNNMRSNTGPVINIDVNSLNYELITDYGRAIGYPDLQPGLADNQGPLIRRNLLTSNDVNGMQIRGGTLTTQSVWDDTDIVHVVYDTVYIPDMHTYGGLRLESSATESLVVKYLGNNAGLYATGNPLDIDDRIGGILHVIGQPGLPVVMTSLHDDSVGAGFDEFGQAQSDTGGAGTVSPGDWMGIIIDENSHDRNVEVVVESESNNLVLTGINGTPQTSQALGLLAPDEYAGDDNRRLGYEIHGFLSSPSDADVYSFEALPGTEVWFDIDRSTHFLDPIIELIDTAGNVIARSVNSFDTDYTLNPLALNDADKITGDNYLEPGNPNLFAVPGMEDEVNVLQKSGFYNLDRWSTNPRDAGMRVVLPGVPGPNARTFHVRVRSNGASIGLGTENLTEGITAGVYQMQLRLSEVDEFAGSTVRYADIRNATNGISVFGQPSSSPLLSESAEDANENNNSFGNAHALGNIFNSDHAALSVAGNLSSPFLPISQTPGDIDWYTFDLQYDNIQTIAGSSDTNLYASLVFDLDYAAGLARANTIISVYDQFGELVLISQDSGVNDDLNHPTVAGENDANADLSRGSTGNGDPFIGNISLPVGTYYIAVSNQGEVPVQMDQFFQANATNPLARLEPVDSVRRIVEDHIDFEFQSTANTPGNPYVDSDGDGTLDSEDEDSLGILTNDNRVSYHLGDFTLFLSVDQGTDLTRLYAVDPFTGAQEAQIGDFGQETRDIAMHPDGTLYAYDLDVSGPNQDDADSGNFYSISTGNATATLVNDGGVTTHEFAADGKTTVIAHQLPNNGPRVGWGYEFEAASFIYTGGAGNGLQLYTVGSRGDVAGNDYQSEFANILFDMNANDGDIGRPRNTTNFPLGQTGDTNAVTLGRINTDFDANGSGGILVPAGEGITDGYEFTIDPDGVLNPNPAVTFEFDLGYQIQLNANLGLSRSILDGELFNLTGSDTEDFIFQTGEVLNFTGEDLTNASEGQRFTLTDSNFTNRTFVLDDSTNGNITLGTNEIRVSYDPATFTQTDFANSIEAAINSSGLNVTATHFNSSARVSLSNNPTVSNVTVAAPFGGMSVDGLSNRVSDNNQTIINIEENYTTNQIIDAIVLAVNQNGQSNVQASALGGTSQVSLFEVGQTLVENSFTPANNLATRTQDGLVTLANSRVQIGFGFTDIEVADAIVLGAATPIPVTTNSFGGSTTAVVNFGATADLTDQDGTLLVEGGAAPGGFITGITSVGSQIYFVTDQGGLYRYIGTPIVDNVTGLVTRSVDFINAAVSLQNETLTSITAGPRNTAGNNSYDDILFISDSSGQIHALDVNGIPQHIFHGGESVLETGRGNVQGIEFGTLNRNLWHTSDSRGGDNGHGFNIPVTNAHGTEGATTSFYFGNEVGYSDDTPFGNKTTQNFDLPGGAHGSIISDPFSLYGYDAADLPTLYFNYFLETDGVDFGDGSSHQDALRVFAADESGNWELLGTSNSFRSTSDDSYDTFNEGLLFPAFGEEDSKIAIDEALRANGIAGDEGVQELFDNSNSWRQARIDLGAFAGSNDIRLRFDFSSSGAINLGGSLGGTSYNTEEIRAISGDDIADGSTFTVTEVGDNTVFTFEFNKGQTLTIDSGTGFADGDMFTLTDKAGISNSVTFEFDSDSSSPANAIPFNTNMTSAEMAEAIFNAIDVAGFDFATTGITLEGTPNPLENDNQINLIGFVDASGLPSGMTVAGSDDVGPNSVIEINSSMSSEEVADAINERLHEVMTPDAYTENYEMFKQFEEFIFLNGYQVNVDNTQIGHDAFIQDDNFGSISATSGQGNQFDGAFIDDLIIGFRERGEMVTDATPGSTAFTANTQLRANELLEGQYQLEIRRGTEYGYGVDGTTTQELFYAIDTNDRLIQGTTINTVAGNQLNPGTRFEVGDGVDSIVFEFVDLDHDFARVGDLAYDTAHSIYTLGFNLSDTAADVANLIRVAINDTDGHTSRSLIDTDRDLGVIAQVNIRTSESNTTRGQVDLSPKSTSDVTLAGAEGDLQSALRAFNGFNYYDSNTSDARFNFNPLPFVEDNNDTASNATETGLDGTILPTPIDMLYQAVGTIGDNPLTDLNGKFADIDMFEFRMEAGQTVRIDIDAQTAGSMLDSVLRLFYDTGGIEPTVVDLSDDNPNTYEVPNELPSFDSYIEYTAPVGEGGRYFVGVSASGNETYTARPLPGHSNNADLVDNHGDYNISIQINDLEPLAIIAPSSGNLTFSTYNMQGDRNTHRDQGQLILQSNEISNSQEYGILLDAAPRTIGGNLPHQGAPSVAVTENVNRFATGVTVTNNVIFGGGDGAIHISGDSLAGSNPEAAVPFGRVINNTLYGTKSGDTGILIDDAAGPTLINNIVANFATAIDVNDTTSQNSTVVSRTLYQNNNNNLSTGGSNGESAPLVLNAADPLFVDAANGNFYLESGAAAIDAAVDSIEERTQVSSVINPLGIEPSPILTPTLDQTGQLRIDDPTVVSSGGVGSVTFRDIGALERSDFTGPTAFLLSPQDNDSEAIDLDPAPNVVQLINGPLSNISIQLFDSSSLSDQNAGSGIDDNSVTTASVLVERVDGTVATALVEGTDYKFDYDATNNIIRIDPISGVFEEGVIYRITLDSDESSPNTIHDVAGNILEPNKTELVPVLDPITGDPVIDPITLLPVLELVGVTSFQVQAGGLLDFGDLPDLNVGGIDVNYGTLLADDGARHTMRDSFFLGSSIEAELDGTPSVLADLDGPSDDGIKIEAPNPIPLGNPLQWTVRPSVKNIITVNTTIPTGSTDYGFLDAWIDLDFSGTFEANEQVVISQPLSAAATEANGQEIFLTSIPSDTAEGETYARFRFSSTGGLNSNGLAIDGEVEDYMITIGEAGDNPWYNDAFAEDVNDDHIITFLDFAPILAELSLHNATFANGDFKPGYDPNGPGFVPSLVNAFLDTNNDFKVTSTDLLAIADFINGGGLTQPPSPEPIDFALDSSSVSASIEAPITIEAIQPIATSTSVQEPVVQQTFVQENNVVDAYSPSYSELSIQPYASSIIKTVDAVETEVAIDNVVSQDNSIVADDIESIIAAVADDLSDVWDNTEDDEDALDELLGLITDDRIMN